MNESKKSRRPSVKIHGVSARGVEIALSVTLAVTITSAEQLGINAAESMSPEQFRTAVQAGTILPPPVTNAGDMLVAQWNNNPWGNGGSKAPQFNNQ